MATRKTSSPARTKPQVPTELKSERIQIALQSLPGWQLGPPQQRIERTFRKVPESTMGGFLTFVLQTCNEEEVEFCLQVRANQLSVQLGGPSGVTRGELAVAEAINASSWAPPAESRAA